MNRPDLTYREHGLHVSFYPVTEAGESAWREIARHDPDGQAVIFALHLDATLSALRRAGYVVRKAKPGTYRDATPISDDQLLHDLGL